MDLGLDVEGYKDYCNNLKMFAKYNNDWEILAKDQIKDPAGLTGTKMQQSHRSSDETYEYEQTEKRL